MRGLSMESPLILAYEHRQNKLLATIDELRAKLNAVDDDKATLQKEVDYWRSAYWDTVEQTNQLMRTVRSKEDVLRHIKEIVS